jgi:hypothetical protein
VSAERRADAIAETIDTLGWCVTIPHTIDQVIGIYAERTAHTSRPMRHGMTNDEIIASISGGGSSGGKGGHSDPTARAALWGEPDAVDNDETVATIRAAVTLCHETAVEIGGICADALAAPHWRPPAPLTLTQTVSVTVAHIHHWSPSVEHTAANLRGEELAHLDTLVRTALAETATWLHDKAFGIWDLYRGETLQAAVQRTIVECRVHAAWVKCPPNAVAGKDLCPRCTTFQERYRCEPTEPIVRRWDYGSEATPGQILEAKAASRKSKRKAG